MTSWSLEALLADLHSSVTEQLARARRTMGHPVAKGDVAESVWAQLLAGYLPQRYKVAKAFVCDSEGRFSDQLDVVVYDRQYSPLIFEMDNQIIIPAESVYAVFEAKQEIDARYDSAESNNLISLVSDRQFPAHNLFPQQFPVIAQEAIVPRQHGANGG